MPDQKIITVRAVRAAPLIALASLVGHSLLFAFATDAAFAQRPSAAASGRAPLTPGGWGPLRIGMTRAQVVAALGPNANPGAYGGSDPASCEQFRPRRAPRGMLVMIENGRLTRISLSGGATVRTDRGLGLGSTGAQVRAAYGRAIVTEPHKYQPRPAERITFWADGPRRGYTSNPAVRGIVYSIKGSGRVEQIHAGGPSIQYVEGCS